MWGRIRTWIGIWLVVILGVSLWVAKPAVGKNVFPAQNLNPTSLSETSIFAPINKYTDPLPIPAHVQPDPVSHELTIRLQQITQRLQQNLPKPATLWGYNGTSPGPVIDVESNVPVRIHWKNELPTNPVLPAAPGTMNMGPVDGSRIVFDGPQTPQDNPMEPMDMPGNLPNVRNITHLHGAAVPETDPMNRLYNNDGWPDAWNVPGQEQIADYPNPQDARTLWYHDHAFGVTGRNVVSGLYGMYLIHDDFERSLNLPSGNYDIPLIFQSLGIKDDGSIYYTNFISTEFYGNSIAVNGKLVPYLDVEPRKYRFRILNGSNARFLGLSLAENANLSMPGPAFYQIGSDAGFLEKPVILNDPTDKNAPLLFLAPAERADVIIDFSKYANRSFILMNTHAVVTHDGEIPVTTIMKFNVGSKVSQPDTSSLPSEIRKITKLDPADAAQTRRVELTQTDFPDGTSMFRMDKRSWSFKKTDAQGDYWDYEIDKMPVLGTTEVWELVNTSPMIHPFHLHLVQFQILDRRPFDVDQYNKTKQVVYTGPATPPDPNEAGWKDVARSNPGEVLRLIMRFGPYPGYFMYHCHILEHEDMDMMVPFQVVPPGSAKTAPVR